MEKTDIISIGHYTFSIEEKAYEMLKNYIARLEDYYLKQADGAEIMDSVEARMAEILYERCGRDGVTNQSDVQMLIDTLGYPEEKHSEDCAKGNDGTKFETGNSEAKKMKKMYRDPEDKKIGGVCSGMAKYFGTDPLWFRLGFVVLTLLFWLTRSPTIYKYIFPTIYLVLMICLPVATTARQRWEMRGESGRVSDIDRYGKNERSRGKEENSGNSRGCLVTGLGIILLLIGFFGLVNKVLALAGVFFAGNLAFGMISWIPGMEELESLIPAANLVLNPWNEIVLTLVVAIPSALILYGGILLTFNVKSPSWKPGLCAFILWVILCIALIPMAFRTCRMVIETLPKSTLMITDDVTDEIEELEEWLEEHNFKTDDWSELDEWLKEHHLDEDDIVHQWLDAHNLIPDECDSTVCPADTLTAPEEDVEDYCDPDMEIVSQAKDRNGKEMNMWSQICLMASIMGITSAAIRV